MKFWEKLRADISKGAARFRSRWQIKKYERRFNGKPLSAVQGEIQEVIKLRGDIYMRDEKTARQLADGWDGTVQKPKDLRFIENAVPVVFCVNESFAPYLAVMLQSLLDNSDPRRNYHFIIFGRGLSDKTKGCLVRQAEKHRHCAVDFVDPWPMLEGIPLVAVNHVSIDAYARLFIPYWLDNYEKVIYLDSDMVARADIAGLYDLDIGPFCIGTSVNGNVSRCIERQEYGYFMKRTALFTILENWPRYINSGVLVFDTKKFAKKFPYRDVFRTAIYFTNRFARRLNDQDVLSLLVKDDYFILPPQWNYCWSVKTNEGKYLPAKPDVKIVHFTGGLKPWKKNWTINGNADAQQYRKYAVGIELFRDSVKI
jgi:lipopolysaccharide biosynthesis glycosyltransferase